MSNTKDVSDTTLKYHLITHYRREIEDRYLTKNIRKHFQIPDGMGDKDVELLRTFFLNYVYPDVQKRMLLGEAFDGLKSFIEKPSKMFALVGNMTGAMLRFGIYFGDAIKSSMVSMQAFVEAQKFEALMLKAAKENDMTLPLSEERFLECLAAIPRKDTEVFLKNVETLFKSFFNTELVNRIVDVLTDVEATMKKKKDLYTPSELEGLQFGLAVLKEGNKLFSRYDKAQKEFILKTIMENERLFLDRVYQNA